MNREQMGAAAPYLSIFGIGLLAGSVYVRTLPDLPAWVMPTMVGVGLLFVMAWPLLRTEDLRDFLSARQARFGGNALLLVVAVLGIVAVLNYLSTLRYVSMDATANQRFSLSNQTNVILDDIRDSGSPIRLTAIMPQAGREYDEFSRLIEKYERRAPNIEVRAFDPTFDITSIRAFQQAIDQPLSGRELIAEFGTPPATLGVGEQEEPTDYRREIVYSFDETAVTEVLLKVTRERDKVIAFTTGHGEYSLTSDPNGRSYSGMRTALEREGYAVEDLALSAVTETITADALVIVGPRQSFKADEVSLLQDFLADGGALLVLLDPQTDHGLEGLFAQWGIRVRDDLVLDPGSNLLGAADLPLIIGDGFRFHPITRDLEQYGVQVVMPGARSIATDEALLEDVTTSVLLETSARSWGATDIEGLSEPGMPEQGPNDATGPLAVAVAAEKSAFDVEDAAAAGRIVVIGSGGLASDGFLQQLGIRGNSIIVNNSINWLTQDEELISIPPPQSGQYPLRVPENPRLMLLATVLFMPAVVAGLGFWVWRSRR